MSKRSRSPAERPATAAPAPAAPGGPSPSSWGSLAGLGALSALWALFLWGELLRSRIGGTPFCAFGPEADCAKVWDSAFAAAVHRWTGLPIAGWGLAWGLGALTLPLFALLRLAEGRPLPALVSAVRATAGAGVVTVFVMLAVSATERAFCLGCFVTYLLVAGYAGISLFGWQTAGLPDPRRGLALAAGATAASFVLLLYPGLRTPRNAGEAGRRVIAEAATAGAAAASAPGTGDAERDRLLGQMVSSLTPELKQELADSLFIYRRSSPGIPPTPRATLGPKGAPVRITEFTDVLCDHCADLHKTLEALGESLPPGSLSVESRQFPLDGGCNPFLPPKPGDSVRCLGARARICLEQDPRAFEFSGAIFRSQKSLTRAKVYDLAAPYMPRRALEACVESAATRKKLEDDVAYASRYDPDATPIVLVNGRLGTSFGPFLYSMALTRGADSHPAFDSLPPPNPNAHLH